MPAPARASEPQVTTETVSGRDRAPRAVALGAPAALIGLQRSAGNRAVGAMLARRGALAVARCPNCGGRCEPDEEPPADAHAHLLARVPSATRTLARCACQHDGKRACGRISGKFGVEDSDTGKLGVVTIDDRIVKQGMAVIDPGTWVTQVPTPPNPEKGGVERGWADGLKVQVADELRAEVVEVKARRGGGCCLASREADGYVRVLTDIAPEIQRISELATATGTGLWAPPGTTTPVLGAMLRGAGIDVGTEKMAQAWAFYNSLQNKLGAPFVKPFTAVRFTVNAGGVTGATHFIDPPVLLRCKDNKGEFWGIERLVFQVNQKGGVSYGCEATCKRRRKRSKEEEAAIAEYERRVLTQPATGATKADVEQADDWDAQQDDEPQVLRPAAITGLLPELQATPLVQALQGGLRERFGAEVAGRRFFLLASQAWVIEFVGKPRAQRTKDLLGTRVSAPLGLGAIGGQMLFWFYGVPMAIAIVVSVGAGAAAGGAAAAGAAAPAATGAGGLTLADLVALGGRAANDVTIQQVSKAAAVVLVLAVARSASADEGARDYGLGEAHGIMAVPVDAVGNQQAGIGDEVDHDGFKRVVVGTAQVP